MEKVHTSCSDVVVTEEEMSIKETVSKITFNYQNSDLLCLNKTMHLPNRNEVIGIIKDLRKIIFPGYFEDVRLSYSYAEYYVGNM